eukprot:TRINITY_DN7267_c0_g4_i13.p1 TRINITY_DN7267_c0_g4~~TRINITY_DN7267_c0_g4_i13.p1  ORF type:complete len:241 (-),score=49.88 TRINITY_DN7267_c0_g4_i13:741-1463(-)
MNVITPLKFPDQLAKLGVSPPSGTILYGPPGTGKTSLACAIANEAGVNFISVEGTQLVSKYVGEGSRAIHELFKTARSCSPCVLFIDHIECLAGARGKDDEEGEHDRMLTSLLTELDGITKPNQQQELHPLILLGATCHLELIDSAFLRPGRMDCHIRLTLPNTEMRREILKKIFQKKPVSISHNIFDKLVEGTRGCCCASLSRLYQEAVMFALRENFDAEMVDEAYLLKALSVLKKQVE